MVAPGKIGVLPGHDYFPMYSRGVGICSSGLLEDVVDEGVHGDMALK